ncbi:cGMP-dependent protein kinase 1, alpha isozyme [uncultured Candidatus Thioglobus sp.]|nr:cGMP-dependent protein kinase 1, alpha isozyme [uncultured Candidatus Thioglobus sp.]
MAGQIQAYKEKIITELLPISEIEEKLQNAIIAIAKVVQYDAGKFIFHEGKRDNYAYYVLKGSVELISNSVVEYTVVDGNENAKNAIAKLQPRQFSARAKSVVTMLQIKKIDMDRLVACQGAQLDSIGSHGGSDTDPDESTDWMTKMLQLDWFVQLPMENIQQLFGLLESVPFKAGSIVMKQGDPGEDYFVIQAGVCEVLRVQNAGEKPKRIAELSAGDHFGEEALLTNSTRNATIRMLTNGVLMKLSKENFLRLMYKPSLESIPYDKAKEIVAAGGKFVDVRSSKEYQLEHVDGSTNIPLRIIRMQLDSLDAGISYITYCEDGNQSSVAAFLMMQHGLQVSYVKGGVNFPPKKVTEDPEEKQKAQKAQINAKQTLDTPSKVTTTQKAQKAQINAKQTLDTPSKVTTTQKTQTAQTILQKIESKHATLEKAILVQMEKFLQEQNQAIMKKMEKLLEQYQAQFEKLKSAYQTVLEAESKKTNKK